MREPEAVCGPGLPPPISEAAAASVFAKVEKGSAEDSGNDPEAVLAKHGCTGEAEACLGDQASRQLHGLECRLSAMSKDRGSLYRHVSDLPD